MTKADIVDVIASATGLTKVETEAVVDGFISTVIDALKSGKNIEIRGFGSFKVKKRKGRMARNPRTGEQVMVDEHFVPIFKVSKDLKHLVDDNLKKAVVVLCLGYGCRAMADPTVISCPSTCTVTVVHELSLPPLQMTAEEGGLVAVAVISVIAVGWGFRMAIRALRGDEVPAEEV